MCATEFIQLLIKNTELRGHFGGFAVIFGSFPVIFERFEKNVVLDSLDSLCAFVVSKNYKMR